MNVVLLYTLLLRATLTSFSGFASVPVVRDELVVHRSVLTDAQLNASLALSQTSPGPLGLYLVGVGYFVAGIPGAIAGVLALSTTAILAIPILWSVQHRKSRRIRHAADGVVIASCVLMVVAAMRLAPTATPGVGLGCLALIAFGLLAATDVPPVIVVAGSALASVIW